MSPTPSPTIEPISDILLPDTDPDDQPPSDQPDNTDDIEEVSLKTLPKTGETSSLPYYIAGLGTAIVGFIFRRKGKKSS
ncbi:LPXTG cell wall anchor domain-containing protein [Paenibacillus ihumii]|uniref:LPXTG cell wall anchor domain-containing protein n=1 Tax=Paenibacillus ihumii TaxID=687436 RepID=UPI0037095A80